jgi:CheY-like chemotaxis protein
MPTFKILLADNSPRVRTVVSKQLELLGLPPDLSEDGQQAVAAATGKIYHLIFMAVISGFVSYGKFYIRSEITMSSKAR